MILFEWGKPWLFAIALVQSENGYQLLFNLFWFGGIDLTVIQSESLTSIGISLRLYKLLTHFSLGIL